MIRLLISVRHGLLTCFLWVRERLKVFESADTDGGANDQVQRLVQQLKESHVG